MLKILILFCFVFFIFKCTVQIISFVDMLFEIVFFYGHVIAFMVWTCNCFVYWHAVWDCSFIYKMFENVFFHEHAVSYFIIYFCFWSYCLRCFLLRAGFILFYLRTCYLCVCTNTLLYYFAGCLAGKLTKAQIKAGYEALKDIETLINKKDFSSRLTEACSIFYTRIPHDFG